VTAHYLTNLTSAFHVTTTWTHTGTGYIYTFLGYFADKPTVMLLGAGLAGGGVLAGYSLPEIASLVLNPQKKEVIQPFTTNFEV
jgi:hypothetical protein